MTDTDPADLRAHTTALRRLARSLCADDSEAEDIVQDVWARTLSGEASPPPEGTGLRAWLRGFVRNRARERSRSARRRLSHERTAAQPECVDDPSERLARVQDLLHHVRNLEPIYRDAIIHRYFDGLSIPEAAARAQVSERTIRTRLHRGIARLRTQMDATHGGRAAWKAALLPFAASAPFGEPLGIGSLIRPVDAPSATASVAVAPGATALALLMKKQLILAAALLAGFGVYVGFAGGEAVQPEAPLPGPTLAQVPAAATGDADAASLPHEPEAPAARTAVPTAQDAPAPEAGSLPLRLRGQIVTADGQPVRDAEVEAWLNDYDRSKSNPLTGTDEEGLFSLHVPPPREEVSVPVHIAVRAAGLALHLESRFVSRDESEVEFLIRMKPAQTIYGLVVDEDRRPVAGASIETFRPAEPLLSSDAEGRFALGDVTADSQKLLVWVTAEGFLGQAAWLGAEALSAQPTPDEPAVVVVMKRGSGVRGVVVDPAGQPVAEAKVYLAQRPAYPKQPVDGTIAETTTDDAGGFSFATARPGLNTLAVLYEDYAPAFLPVSVPEDRPLITKVELEPGHAVQGHVRSSMGAPTGKTTVYAYFQGSLLRTVTPAEDGTFRVRGLPASGFDIGVTADGHLPQSIHVEQVPVGPLEFVLAPAARIAATVVDARTNLPVTEFFVRLLPPSEQGERKAGKGSEPDQDKGALEWLIGKVISSADGTWDTGSTPIPEGFRASIEVRAEGYASLRVDDLVARRDADPSDRIIALLSGTNLRGRVVAPDGSPIAGASVVGQPQRTQPSDEGSVPSKGQGTALRAEKARTGADGTFTLSNLEPGPFQVRVLDAEWGEHSEVVWIQGAGAEQDIELVMPAGGALEGTALDGTGQGLQKELVQVRLANGDKGPARTATTDAQGRFRFEHLAPGAYTVELMRPSRGIPKLSSARTSRSVEVTVGSTARVELQASGGVTVLGSVTLRSADGELLPLPGWVLITLTHAADESTPAHERHAPIRELSTDPGASYRVADVPPGAWDLEVLHTNKATQISYRAVQRVDVPSRGELTLDLELREVGGR
jgi:RNA polymerase sigma-70 factor (ECF subfamily)